MAAGSADAELTIPSRYRGPARSANGGYAAGSLAEHMRRHGRSESPVVEVTLRLPPPLDATMTVRQVVADETARTPGGPTTVLRFGDETVAEAREVPADLEPVEPVSLTTAGDAMARYPGLTAHPFPTCFSCGPERAIGDGLRIFPGKVGEGRVASLWVPHVSLAESSDVLDARVQHVGLPTAWAALDCVGGWAGDMAERSIVLGRITAQVDALPVVGEPHVVVGQSRAAQGRKTFTASTLYDSDGRIVARAEHVWLAIDPDVFN